MKNLLRITFCLFLLASCKQNKDNLIEQVLPPEGELELGAFNLVFPDNNLICTEGTAIGDNEISIDFMWTASENATAYDLEITNQDSGAKINESSSTTEKTVVLPKGTQFSWTITAKLGEATKSSDSWNFYSEGIAEENFAPFPAEITTEDQTNGFVEISWTGSDLDNDIETFELYFGTDAENLEFIASTSGDSSSSQPIIYGTNYYIEIITKDARGNSSSSITTVNYQG